jgi:hypothetical protein
MAFLCAGRREVPLPADQPGASKLQQVGPLLLLLLLSTFNEAGRLALACWLQQHRHYSVILP